MFGTGIGHYVPLAAYLGFWVMSIVSLTGRPVLGLYYMIPFLPYRTLRDHFLDFPLGANMLTILVIAIIVGALIKGRRMPKSRLYMIWAVFGLYLYLSMWIGTAMGNGPAPLWLDDVNFVTWKDYMVIPLVFLAAGLAIKERKEIRLILILTCLTVFFIDRSSLFESISRTWTNFDENKRSGGPLSFGSNQTAAYLAQFGIFIWGLVQFTRRIAYKIVGYLLVAITVAATMYTFSRGGYLAFLVGVLLLGLLKDRKLLLLLVLFLATWTAVVPTPVLQRVSMTQDSSGKLEDSAQERIDLWQDAEGAIERSPVLGSGFATYQYSHHVDNLKDTHNWYIKILVETGIVGFIIALILVQQMAAVAYKLFKKAKDPLYRGLGLGLFLAICSCLVANCFGDRWTYLEITGPLWVLVAASIRAMEDSNVGTAADNVERKTVVAVNPYMAYR